MDRQTDRQTDGRYQVHYLPRFVADKYINRVALLIYPSGEVHVRSIKKINDHSQLKVQWAYSGHLMHLQWGTVHALHQSIRAIGTSHCRWYAVYVQCPTAGALSAHCTPTALQAGTS